MDLLVDDHCALVHMPLPFAISEPAASGSLIWPSDSTVHGQRSLGSRQLCGDVIMRISGKETVAERNRFDRPSVEPTSAAQYAVRVSSIPLCCTPMSSNRPNPTFVDLLRLLSRLKEAKFHYASWFGAGSKLVRAEIWPII